MKYHIPEQIETERLLLRTFKEDDWKDLYAYYSDPVCMKYTTGKPHEEWETWRKMAMMIGHWELRKYGPYAIEIKDSGKVAGPVGLWFPQEWPEPEIKWGLARNFWGMGYAREAALAVREMAAKYLPELKLISLIDPENTGSLKVATSIGAKFERTTRLRDMEGVHVYRHK